MRLDPETMLAAYSRGAFPMAERDGRIRWFTADPRGVLPLEGFHVSKTLAQTLRSGRFEIRVNADFEGTLRACMAERAGHTWITEELIAAYVRLHEMGYAHSVEAWRGGELAGGLYGVSLGGAFFGESMFHRQRDASKAALAGLVGRLVERGYALLDTQTCTPHLARFGCVEISAEEYMRRLEGALGRACKFV